MRFFNRKKKDVIVQRADMSDLEAISAIHARCFERGWSATDLAEFYARQSMRFWVARQIGAIVCGFNIVRHTKDEAEIVSIAVHPDFQKGGIGAKLMQAEINRLLADKVPALFLEVQEDNKAAIALYRRLGFGQVGRRENYYSGGEKESARIGALVMRLELG